MSGHGLQGTLLSVRAQEAGFSSTVSGIVMAMNFAGFMVGTGIGLRAVERVGHIRVFAAFASMASSVTLLAAVWVSPIPWGVFRFAWGALFAGLLVVLESWLNEQASNENRGRYMAIYMVVTMGSIAGGHLLTSLTDVSGFAPFVLASVVVSLSLVPMALSRASAPTSPVPTPLGLMELVRIVPTGVVVTFLTGAALGTIGSVLSVYGAAAGLSLAHIGLITAAPMVGSVLLQIPIGRLSDVLPRRPVIMGCALVAGSASLLLLTLPASSIGALAVMFVMGGFAYPLYSLAIAFSNDWLEPAQRTGASALLVRVNGTGAIFGPIAASLALAVSLKGLFVVLAVPFMSIAVYVAARIVLVRGPKVPTVASQSKFIAIPARASRAATALLARSRRPRRPTE